MYFLFSLQDFLIKKQIRLRVEYPGLRYHLNSCIADVNPLTLGDAAAILRTWNTHEQAHTER